MKKSKFISVVFITCALIFGCKKDEPKSITKQETTQEPQKKYLSQEEASEYLVKRTVQDYEYLPNIEWTLLKSERVVCFGFDFNNQFCTNEDKLKLMRQIATELNNFVDPQNKSVNGFCVYAFDTNKTNKDNINLEDSILSVKTMYGYFLDDILAN